MLPVGPHSTSKDITLETYLGMLSDSQMLDRIKVAQPGGPAVGGQGRRKSMKIDEEEGGMYEWKWGTRAHAEISETSVAEFMVEFLKARFVEDGRRAIAEDEEEAEANPPPRGGKNPKPKTTEERHEELKQNAKRFASTIFKDIERAAGKNLTTIQIIEPVEDSE